MKEREAIHKLIMFRRILEKGVFPVGYKFDAEPFDMAVAALEKQEQGRWHSVAKEGNPPKSGLYIVVDNSKLEGDTPHTRYFNAYDRAFWSGWRPDNVIAWKEITSEPYTEEEA